MPGQVDSTVVDSASYGLSNVMQNNGLNITFSGIIVIFVGLVLIALTIHLFNILSAAKAREGEGSVENDQESRPKRSVFGSSKDIPPDHLVAIATAIELYRRLHFETLESKVTFERGETNTNWKTGFRYGQRNSLR